MGRAEGPEGIGRSLPGRWRGSQPRYGQSRPGAPSVHPKQKAPALDRGHGCMGAQGQSNKGSGQRAEWYQVRVKDPWPAR